ncbi:MAG: GntR family transcriptional regulator [Kiritimatiellae bacterium]|nr:GntR family transcriptional regulator [Kiritimatiellia bacterium]
MDLDIKLMPKFWRFKQDMRRTLADRRLRPGDRLPGVRELAKVYRLSVGTVRKALGDLCDEGLLTRRQGSGTFVRDAAPPGEQDLPSPAGGARQPAAGVRRAGGGPASRPGAIAFCAASMSEDLAQVWRQCVAAFEKRNPNASVHLVEDALSTMESASLSEIDVIETGGMLSDVHLRFAAADLGVFDAPQPASSSRQAPVYMAPLHVRVPCLLCNLDLLRTLGLAPPDYVDVRGQMAFFEALLKRMRQPRGSGTTLSCNIVPFDYLGGLTHDLVAGLLGGEAPSIGADRLDIVTTAIRLKEIFMHDRTPYDYNDAHYFLEGRAPVFPAWDYTAAEYKRRKTPFALGVHPFFSADNTIVSNAMGLMMNAETQAPVECMRFIRFMQSEEAQTIMKAGGLIPSNGMDMADVVWPRARYRPEQLKAWTERIRPRLPPTQEERYLVISVIDSELFAASDARSYLNSVWAMGKGYTRFLKHQAERAAAKNR